MAIWLLRNGDNAATVAIIDPFPLSIEAEAPESRAEAPGILEPSRITKKDHA